MPLFSLLRNKLFFRRILFLFSSISILLLVSFSVAIYYNVKSTFFNNQYEMSKKNLALIKSGVEKVSDSIDRFATFFFNDPSTVNLAVGRDLDVPEIYTLMRQLEGTTNSADFVKAFHIFNYYQNTFFSNTRGFITKENLMGDLAKQPSLLKKQKVISVTLRDNSGAPRPAFVYLKYDGDEPFSPGAGLVIFEIDSKWLFDSLASFNDTEKQSDDSVYVVDGNGNFLGAMPTDQKVSTVLLEKYLKSQEPMNDLFKEEKISGKRYLITGMDIEKTGWVLFRVQNYDNFYRHLNSYKLILVLITITFLLLSAIANVTISRRIYTPIGKLFKEVASSTGGINLNSKKLDEMAVIKEAYTSSASKVAEYEQKMKTQSLSMKGYYLRNLFVGSSTLESGEYTRISETAKIAIPEVGNLMACILRVDNYKGFLQKNSPDDRGLLKYAIINITSEVLGQKFANEAVDMDTDRIAYIISLPDMAKSTLDSLYSLLAKAQGYVEEYLKMTFTASISEPFSRISELTDRYNAALEISYYRLVKGTQSIIDKENVRENAANIKFEVPFKLESALLEVLKTGTEQSAVQFVESAFTAIQSLSYNNIILTLKYLQASITNYVEELRQARIDPLSLNISNFQELIFDCDTLEELKQPFISFIQEVQLLRKSNTPADKKHEVLVNSIKDYTYANYADKNLCLNQVADFLKMSSQYVGKIFKDATGTSYAKFINDVRLEKAVELIEGTKLSVLEILDRIGMEYESHFYKIFKEKYGTTPKEYILKKALK